MCFFFCDVCFAFHCSYCIFVNYFFFFFKQKTAYEMRISDWSSDVCSSDLPINATRSPILSVFPSLSDLVRIAVIGPELTDIFLLAARGPSDGQGRGRRSGVARRGLVSAEIWAGHYGAPLEDREVARTDRLSGDDAGMVGRRRGDKKAEPR